jgi:hypothetical protein
MGIKGQKGEGSMGGAWVEGVREHGAMENIWK